MADPLEGRLVVRLKEAFRLIGCRDSKGCELVRDGRLKVIRIDHMTLAYVSSIRELLSLAPPAAPFVASLSATPVLAGGDATQGIPVVSIPLGELVSGYLRARSEAAKERASGIPPTGWLGGSSVAAASDEDSA
jgi:hypothetical protein